MLCCTQYSSSVLTLSPILCFMFPFFPVSTSVLSLITFYFKYTADFSCESWWTMWGSLEFLPVYILNDLHPSFIYKEFFSSYFFMFKFKNRKLGTCAHILINHLLSMVWYPFFPYLFLLFCPYDMCFVM